MGTWLIWSEDVDELEDLRDRFWKGAWGEGDWCPVCDRWGKVHKRKLNKGMVRCLIYLYQQWRKGVNEYIHVPSEAPRHVLNSAEIGKLQHWGLAENMPNEDDPTKKHTGYWMILSKGIAFLEGRVKVPSHVYIFDNTPLEFTQEMVDPSWCLGEPFDYRELMDERANDLDEDLK
jgi:hypothetical protein